MHAVVQSTHELLRRARSTSPQDLGGHAGSLDGLAEEGARKRDLAEEPFTQKIERQAGAGVRREQPFADGLAVLGQAADEGQDTPELRLVVRVHGATARPEMHGSTIDAEELSQMLPGQPRPA